MSPNQADALRLLIAADRRYRSNKALGRFIDPDDRGIEIWTHGDVHPATARSLAELGLAVIAESRSSRSTKLLFLGRLDPLDEVHEP